MACVVSRASTCRRAFPLLYLQLLVAFYLSTSNFWWLSTSLPPTFGGSLPSPTNTESMRLSQFQFLRRLTVLRMSSAKTLNLGLCCNFFIMDMVAFMQGGIDQLISVNISQLINGYGRIYARGHRPVNIS